MKEVKIHGIYKHYKGDSYIVEDIGYNTETGEKMVVYRALYGENRLWCRPWDLFVGQTAAGLERFTLQEIESVRKKQ